MDQCLGRGHQRYGRCACAGGRYSQTPRVAGETVRWTTTDRRADPRSEVSLQGGGLLSVAPGKSWESGHVTSWTSQNESRSRLDSCELVDPTRRIRRNSSARLMRHRVRGFAFWRPDVSRFLGLGLGRKFTAGRFGISAKTRALCSKVEAFCLGIAQPSV